MELLLLLRRSPDTFWTSDAAAQKLGIGANLAAKALSRLANAKLLARGVETAAYRFAPADDAIRAALDELATAYQDQRITVINSIYSTDMERLRAFADAFRLKDE